MKYIIFSLLLIIFISSCHKKITTSSTTTTVDTISSTKIIKKDSLLKGSHVDAKLNLDSLKNLAIGQSRSYYDSLHQVQMRFFRDSLGTIHGECIENNRNFHYEYPEKTYYVNTHSTTTNNIVTEKKIHERSFWDNLLIGGLIVLLILLVLAFIFKK